MQYAPQGVDIPIFVFVPSISQFVQDFFKKIKILNYILYLLLCVSPFSWYSCICCCAKLRMTGQTISFSFCRNSGFLNTIGPKGASVYSSILREDIATKCLDHRGIGGSIFIIGLVAWKTTQTYTVKPVFKGHHDERTPSIQQNLSSRGTLMRGHPLYSKTCPQGALWWEDTIYTVKPVLKGHSDERTPSIQ